VSPAELVAALVSAAKTWRGLAKLVVLVVTGAAEHAQELVVKLGESRRRWKRVGAAIEPIAGDIIGARGYDDAGELVGSWDAPDDDEDPPDELHAEPAEHAAHRQHTQWVIREVGKLYEGITRLNIELCQAAIEIVRGSLKGRAEVATPAESDDATKTLGMLLAMANQKGASEYAETERDAGSPSGDTRGQGQPQEPSQAGT
jgi:hypothetical protein